jgi:iron complex outermembrane receptor protein
VQGDYYHGREGVINAGVGHVAGGNLLSRWSKKLSSDSGVQLQLYYDRTYLEVPVPAGLLAPAGIFRDDLETYDLDFQHNFRVGETHALVWGWGYRRVLDNAKSAPDFALSPAKVTQDLFSAFGQDQIAFDGQTRLTFGAKLEHTDYTGFEFEPSVRLQRDLGDSKLVWGAISRAVRTPSRLDRDIRRPGTPPFLATGVDTYRSESVVAYELGLRDQINARLGGSFSLFYNDYDHVRSVRSTPVTGFPLYFANDLEGESHGAELSFDTDVKTGWRVRGGYRVLISKLHVRQGGMDVNNGLAETADPEHQINLGTSIDLPGNIEFDGLLRWVDELRVNNAGQAATIPSYFDLSLRAGMRVTENVELSINGMNLLQDRHVEIGNPGPNRVEVQRSVFAKIALRY